MNASRMHPSNKAEKHASKKQEENGRSNKASYHTVGNLATKKARNTQGKDQ